LWNKEDCWTCLIYYNLVRTIQYQAVEDRKSFCKFKAIAELLDVASILIYYITTVIQTNITYKFWVRHPWILYGINENRCGLHLSCQIIEILFYFSTGCAFSTLVQMVVLIPLRFVIQSKLPLIPIALGTDGRLCICNHISCLFYGITLSYMKRKRKTMHI